MDDEHSPIKEVVSGFFDIGKQEPIFVVEFLQKPQPSCVVQ